MEGSRSPKTNRLLAQLPEGLYARLQPHLELVQLEGGSVLHKADDALRHIVFPVSGLIGRLAMTSEGKSTELSLVGSEGMIGVSLLLGGRPLSSTAIVLASGHGYRIAVQALLALGSEHAALHQLMLRYGYAVVEEVIQVTLCDKHHSLEQRLCRWLLMGMDRGGGQEIRVTQALISHMLGVRREGITETAGKLEALHIVKRMRGAIVVVNRDAMKRKCCECYDAIRRHYQESFAAADVGEGIAMAPSSAHGRFSSARGSR